MSIRILHTADNHIGMKFSSYSPATRDRLINERLDSLKQIVDVGNTQLVNYLVIAGDLFDTTTVKVSDITKTAGILKEFKGDAVIIIPGNHDFFESATESLWSRFKKIADDQKVFLLSAQEVFEHEIGEQKVNFFPAPCHSKHSEVNMIGWVKDYPKDPTALNIGIAHGNVTGLGLDDADKYFNMTTTELKATNLDLWLLGHIHVPYPQTQNITQNPGFFMSGFHTPDGWKRNRGGGCWMIEVDENKNIKAELLPTGTLRFYDWEKTINSEVELAQLQQEINQLTASNSLVRLTVNGRLPAEVHASLSTMSEEWSAALLEFYYQDHVKLNIDEQYINIHYSTGSLPHSLLTELSHEDSDGLELQLANDLIEKIKL